MMVSEQLSWLFENQTFESPPNPGRSNQPRQLPATDEGTEMAKLRTEMHRRMLGNGYCARPVELDCHFESICESCTFFVTTVEFKPTLRRQREDAHNKGQIGREKFFDGRLNRLDNDQTS